MSIVGVRVRRAVFTRLICFDFGKGAHPELPFMFHHPPTHGWSPARIHRICALWNPHISAGAMHKYRFEQFQKWPVSGLRMRDSHFSCVRALHPWLSTSEDGKCFLG